MARNHRMTPARRAALRKAQLASARKRRGKGKKKPSVRTSLRNLNTIRKDAKQVRKNRTPAQRRKARKELAGVLKPAIGSAGRAIALDSAVRIATRNHPGVRLAYNAASLAHTLRSSKKRKKRRR